MDLQSGGQFYIDLISFETFDVMPPDCTAAVAPTFLSIWSEIHNSTDQPGTLELRNISASFCQATYSSQNVLATIAGSNFSLLNIHPTSPKVPLTSTMFNSTVFDALFLEGIGDVKSPLDQADVLVADSSYGLPSNVNVYVSEPVGFAFGLSKLRADQFYVSELRNQAFASVHKFLFSLAVNRFQGSLRQLPDSSYGIVSTDLNTILVVRIFAVIVECLLGLVGACSILLLVFLQMRRSRMAEDSASIEDISALFATDRSTLEDFIILDTANVNRIEEKLRGYMYTFRLKAGSRSLTKGASIIRTSNQQRLQTATPKPSKHSKRALSIKDHTIPFQMSQPFAMIFVTVILMAMVLLAVLYRRTTALNGESTCSSFSVLSIQGISPSHADAML